MSSFNPYEPPKVEVIADTRDSWIEDGAWRDGALLRMTRDAVLPDRCVSCDAPAEGWRLRRNLSWHHPAWYLTLLLNILIYLIVALAVRKTARIEVGLCPRHRARRSRDIAIGWIGTLVGLGMIALGFMMVERDDQIAAVLVVVGLLVALVSLIYGMARARVVVPRRISERFIWLNKVAPAYLADLPDWDAAWG